MTTMKKLITVASASILLTGSGMANSIPLGRGELILTASASGTYDSNLSGRSSSKEDYYGTFAPRISYLRRAGKIEADASVEVSSSRYLDHTEFDSDNVSSQLSVHLSQKSFQNISASLTASYIESFDVNNDVNERIKTAATTVTADASLITGPRTSFAVQGGYSKSNREGASDQKSLNGGLTFNYKGFLDDTTLSVVYGYSQTESSGENLRGASLDQNSNSLDLALSRALYHDVTGRIGYGYRILDRSAAETSSGDTREAGTTFTASVDGPFLPPRMFPKITSRASIAYSSAATPGVNDSGGKQVTGDLSLSWEARQNTSVSFGAGRSQRLSATDLTVVSSNVHLSLQQQLRYNLTGSLTGTYGWETYRAITRKDEILSTDANLSYSFAHSWNASAAYRYTSSTSSQTISQYVRHVATVTLGYTF
jgi:hypothetical protein